MEASGLGPLPTQPWPSGLRLTTCPLQAWGVVPSLDHLSLLGPSMTGPLPHLSGAAPGNLSRHPAHSHSRVHAEQLLLQRRLESGPPGEDPHPRSVAWTRSPLSPLESASCRMLAGHCLLLPADWVRGSKTAVRRRRVGKGGGSMQGAWPGERMMEEAESEGEEVRAAGGAAGNAEKMASGDG